MIAMIITEEDTERVAEINVTRIHDAMIVATRTTTMIVHIIETITIDTTIHIIGTLKVANEKHRTTEV